MLLLSSAARIHSLVEPIESRHSDFFPEIASSPETNFKAIPFPTNFVNFEVSPSKSSSNITFSLPTSLTGAAAAEFFGVFPTAFNFESSRDFALPLLLLVDTSSVQPNIAMIDTKSNIDIFFIKNLAFFAARNCRCQCHHAQKCCSNTRFRNTVNESSSFSD